MPLASITVCEGKENLMTIDEIGTGLVALCKTGKFDDAIAAYYSDDIVSIEAMPGDMHEM